MSRFWHPFADMHTVATNEVVMERGDGVRVWDTNGRSYLDATAGLWYCNVGYGRGTSRTRPRSRWYGSPSYSTFGVYTTEPTLRLADRLAALSPIDDAVVFLTSGGSEAIDTAAKLARRYWDVVGKPERRIIVSREHAYHGMAAFGTSLGGHRRRTGRATAARSSKRSSTSPATIRRRSRRCSKTTGTRSRCSSASR